MVFHGAELCPAMILCRLLHVVELIAIHGGSTDGPHLPSLHQLMQGFHGLLNGGIIVKAVDNIQIQIIRPKPLQGSFNFPGNGGVGEATLVEVNLGGNYHFVPGNHFLQGPAQVFLTGSGGVAIGSVKEIDAQIQSMADDLGAGSLVQ